MNTEQQSLDLSMDMDLSMDHATPMVDEEVAAFNSETPSDTSDCCDQDCNCPLGNCSSALLLSGFQLDWQIVPFEKNTQGQLLLIKLPTPSLYRPPICL